MSDGATEIGARPGRTEQRSSGRNLRDVYAAKGLSQIPRLLSLQDRNPLSRTYGCFNREYWLCRTVDFPSAIAQFGVHSLALAYVTPFPDNSFHRAPKIREWTLAGIDYWIRIQKNDGSFDEFYPNERGWAGPTGFLLYVMCDTYRLLGAEFPESERPRFLEAVARAGRFLAKYDEPGVLANHHAMAILPIYEAYALLGEKSLLDGFHVRLDDFLGQTRDEGWCLEYDGADLGYLSATVSFLSKLHKLYQDERTEAVCHRAIEFASYFAYPNKHYAGSMGSRQTLHFYPHGFEIYAGQGNGLAAAVAQRLLEGLDEGALVPPEIQEDRYFLYRIPELLQSWVDYGGRPTPLPPLPDQREPFQKYWPGAKIHARKGIDAKGRAYYTLINLAKGGVIKHFRLDTGASVENDCGFVAKLEDGKVITSQWISEGNVASGPDEGNASGMVSVRAPAHYVVMKLFNPITMIGFRVFMLAVGWNTRLAYEIKGWIRKLLMTRSGASPVGWKREVSFEDVGFTIRDRIERGGASPFTRLLLGDEFHVRYVPQSRYFQPQELSMHGIDVEPAVLERLNHTGSITIVRRVDYYDGMLELRVED